MPIPFAINGLGRIGRALVRISLGDPALELVAVNDLAPPRTLAGLLARDSVHGPLPATVEAEEGALILAGRRVSAFREPDPARVPWPGTGARIVVEATGRWRQREAAARHLGGEVAKVLVSALAEGADLTLCPGINEADYRPDRHHVLSSASCTTHCLALILAVLDRELGVEEALMNEVHSYTGSQALLDAPHEDPRRGRAAAVNIVPTSTAAPAAVAALLPGLPGRVGGQAVRVPTPNVALLDLVAVLRQPAPLEAVYQAFRAAAEGPFAGLLGVCEEPLVSTDFYGDPRSAVVDLALCARVGERLLRVGAWYDNEWGYSHRLSELLSLIGETLE